MTEPASGPIPFRVSYSQLVRSDLIRLAARARASGVMSQFLNALKEIDQRLRVYPRFGQPLCDLTLEPLKIWIGVVPPLVVRYVIDEERRLVMVATPFLPLPQSGF